MTKIFIDPGHGGSDPGAVANGLKEKDLVLTISRQIRDMILSEYQDVQVQMSRDSDIYLSLAERATLANAWGADYFVSIHCNAGGGTGFETFIHDSRSTKSVAYQNVVHPAILDKMGVRDRGKKAANFAVLRLTNMPAILTENLFVDNTNDAKLLKDPAFLQQVARGHVEGIEKAFGIKSNGRSSFVSKPSSPPQQLKKGEKPTQTKTGSPQKSAYDLIRQYAPDVARLQRQLIAVGENLSRFGVDGMPGDETLQAIKSFQRKEGITVDGIPGPVTQSRLKAKLKYSRLLQLRSPMMRGQDVRAVQLVVKTVADSIFGQQTERGVKEYQREHKLQVDGKVGPQTWGHMFG